MMTLSTPRKGFHDLPAEIRNQIYENCSPPVAVLACIRGNLVILERMETAAWYNVKPLNILQLNRRTRAEATGFLFDKCTFAIMLQWQLQTPFEAIFARYSDRIRSSGPQYGGDVLLPHIRNWLIDLRWDLRLHGNSQPRDFKRLLESIVKVLYKNESANSITIKHPCACSTNRFRLLYPDQYWWNYNSAVFRSVQAEGCRTVFDMLEPLTRLHISRTVAFVPMTFRINNSRAENASKPWTGSPHYIEKLCGKDLCHRLTDRIKDTMVRRNLGPQGHDTESA